MGWKAKGRFHMKINEEAKHFLINVGTNMFWPVFLLPLTGRGLECCLWHATPSVYSGSGVRMLAYRSGERSAVYWSVHGVLIHIFFSTLISCQNAISEIVERMENVQPEGQKTQEKDKRAWSLNAINWKLVMGKESCLALFQREQQPQMGKKVIKE